MAESANEIDSRCRIGTPVNLSCDEAGMYSKYRDGDPEMCDPDDGTAVP
jgi:hypothetical protein